MGYIWSFFAGAFIGGMIMAIAAAAGDDDDD